MTSALILWGHALTALLFGGLAVHAFSTPSRAASRAALTIALALTALWALAVAGIGPSDRVASIAYCLRNIAWIAVMFSMVRRDPRGTVALGAVYLAVAGTMGIAMALSVLSAMPFDAQGLAAIAYAQRAFVLIGSIGALLLLHELTVTAARPVALPLLIALTLLWSFGTASAIAGGIDRAWSDAIAAARGFAMVATGAILAAGMRRGGGEDRFSISRTVVMRSVSVVAVLAYAAIMVAMTGFAETLDQRYARIVQTAMVFGSTAALMTLLSTPWLRAWTKVKVAKHLFRHRFDYRAEWQRFTAALGTSSDDAAPLGQRVVKAIADLTDSPSGALLSVEGTEFVLSVTWQSDIAEGGSADFVSYLERCGRIVDVDAVRERRAPSEEVACTPQWIVANDDIWAVVPLFHGAALIGAIVLARPPVDRALDWEDFDLLRVAGRQAASYLAEDRAYAALADAARFDEFNRRFAFILHDIKNLVSGLTLVARNAERHADNPDFRADMVATLNDSAGRMNALLAKLSQQHQPSAEALQDIDLARVVARIAAGRRAQHPMETIGSAVALVYPAHLDQLLGHLVQNAIDASPPGVPVVLSVGSVAGRAYVDIVDRGVGMTASFVRDQLFRPFASSKAGGFGIGAYEARQLARGMGGSIEVDSREGQGTRFRVWLPLASQMDEAA